MLDNQLNKMRKNHTLSKLAQVHYINYTVHYLYLVTDVI